MSVRAMRRLGVQLYWVLFRILIRVVPDAGELDRLVGILDGEEGE